MREIVEQIIGDVTEPDGVPRIDVVIGTHRHRDHVSGFDNPAWAHVEVKEVWLPWTEDPKDPQARKIRDRQSSLALQLQTALADPAVLASLPQLAVEDQAQLLGMVSNALTNAAAMSTLHDGFSGNPRRRFLPNKQGDRTVDTTVLPGLVVHVLGPSRDDAVIRDMDPPAGAGYLRRRLGHGGSDAAAPEPFHMDWRIDHESFWYSVGSPDGQTLTAADQESIRNASAGEELAIAVALEKAVNGTSLMLILQVGQAHLLFPGDAQWGTWQAAMADQEWRDLLSKTVFYKIGHHGSHNATPREFVEKILGDDFWAMASTHPVKQWPRIPKKELMAALVEREGQHRVVRSDKDTAPLPPGFTGTKQQYVDARVPIR
jgi:beta-lactamase superfamily II metal-dependent hydrolase